MIRQWQQEKTVSSSRVFSIFFCLFAFMFKQCELFYSSNPLVKYKMIAPSYISLAVCAMVVGGGGVWGVPPTYGKSTAVNELNE